MLPRFSTLLVGTARGVSRLFNNELAVIITPHKIKLRMMDPDSDAVAWDESHFTHGCIFFQGWANPIKPKVPDDNESGLESEDIDLIASDRYKKFMEQSLIDDIIDEGTESGWLSLELIAIVLGTLQLANVLMILYLLLQI